MFLTTTRVPTLAHPLVSQILWARAGGWGPALYLLYRLCKIVSECKDGYNCWSTARMPSHIALQCADASLLPCPRRGGVGAAGGIEPVCTDARDGARPRGERKDPLDDGVEHK